MDSLIPHDRYVELLAVLQAPGEAMVTPLGIRREGGRLVARLYPGTRLQPLGYSVYEACLAQPYDPLSYYSAVLEHSVELEPARAVHAPCPRAEGPRVEAIVSSRERAPGGFIVLWLDPIHVEEGGGWALYSRSLGCSIELLIALTRLRFWARARSLTPEPPCRTVRRLAYTVLESFDCILHSTWSPELHRAAARAAREALDNAYMTGCLAPSEVEAF